MSKTLESTSQRKKEHLELCLTDDVSFKEKKNGFNNYEFEHFAITEVELDKISLKTKFFKREINYPFLISCMTGGTTEAENINAQLAFTASSLNIPLGVGSQRQALENNLYHKSFKVIRKNAPKIPILGNIGAAQLINPEIIEQIKFLIDLIEADAFVIHINPLQELLQKGGDPNFKGFLKAVEKICSKIKIPVIAKEVGAGISQKAAKKLLDAGVSGIDIAGAGGTSWAAVEIKRNKDSEDNPFWDWGIPSSYCIKTVSKLKKDFNFLLIGSGGINTGVDAAKALALGADIIAAARIILQTLDKNGTDGVEQLILSWFDTLKKIMFLTGCQDIKAFRKIKLFPKKEIY
jgi:isopentenyl-diphosphate Delta-isomerase